MRKRWVHLVVDGDGANDHLLGVLSLHVVEPEGVDIGGQMTTHLVRPDTIQVVWSSNHPTRALAKLPGTYHLKITVMLAKNFEQKNIENLFYNKIFGEIFTKRKNL